MMNPILNAMLALAAIAMAFSAGVLFAAAWNSLNKSDTDYQ